MKVIVEVGQYELGWISIALDRMASTPEEDRREGERFESEDSANHLIAAQRKWDEIYRKFHALHPSIRSVTW